MFKTTQNVTKFKRKMLSLSFQGLPTQNLIESESKQFTIDDTSSETFIHLGQRTRELDPRSHQ